MASVSLAAMGYTNGGLSYSIDALSTARLRSNADMIEQQRGNAKVWQGMTLIFGASTGFFLLQCGMALGRRNRLDDLAAASASTKGTPVQTQAPASNEVIDLRNLREERIRQAENPQPYDGTDELPLD